MGAYCCCGKKIGYIGYSEQDCVCDQTGWTKVEDSLPNKDGKYLTRVMSQSCDRYEEIQEFYTQKRGKPGDPYDLQNWENQTWEDNIVYQWKEIVDMEAL